MTNEQLSKLVKPEWFGGDQAGVDMAWAIANMTHIWDDLIDKDKPVSDESINNMMRIALIQLPSNRVYQKVQSVAPAFWAAIISAYEAANKFEKDKDEKGIEIAHVLRYSAGNLFAVAMECCVGYEKAREMIPEMWKVVVFERFEEYRKEHLYV